MADKEKNTRSAASKERYFQAGVALVTVLLFFGILIGLGCVTTFSEKESFSENQNKAPGFFPEIQRQKALQRQLHKRTGNICLRPFCMAR